MSSSAIISAFLIMAGAAVMLLSIALSLNIRKLVSKGMHRKWLFTISLMVFFFFCYVIYVCILLFEFRFPPELVTGSIFLGGACFIYIMVKLIQTTVERLHGEIAESRNAEKAIQESENRYRSLVESTDDSIYLVDNNYKYLFMNKKHLSRLGLLGEQFMERDYSEFHSAKETKSFVEKVNQVFETGKSAQYEYRSLRDNRYFLQTFSPVKNADGKIVSATVVSKEISGLKQVEDKLRALSFTDELTGLYNRRGFFVLGDQQLKLANREKKGRFLISADLDDLKSINDKFGHKEGDLILLETALLLRKSFRESDIIARIGGDEFVVLSIETPETNIENLTLRLKTNLNDHNSRTNKAYRLSLSLGLKRYDPDNPCSIDDLLSEADKLMYVNKRNKGHNH
jgi:diguanylate cyclase (GGDEF)-like protein/PAS domain S-box-containing protein